MKYLILILLLAAFYTGGVSTDYDSDEMTEYPTETQIPTTGNKTGVINLSDDNYYESLNNSSGIVLVDFWAEWCGPCLELGPILEDLSKEKNIPVYKVNVDDCPQISADFAITAIPMVYVYKDGQIVDSILGLSDKSTYEDIIDSYN